MAIELIEEAVAGGARIAIACKHLGITAKTYRNWKATKSLEDGRLHAKRPERQARQLSVEEEAYLIERLAQSDVVDKTPAQAFYTLLDKGEYVGSISTIYRYLEKHKQLKSRTGCASRQKRSKPQEFVATEPNQVWTWDITYFKDARYPGHYFFAYVIVDLYSRYIVQARVFDADNSDYAVEFLRGALWEHRINQERGLVLHSDNGSSMKAAQTLALLDVFGVKHSHSRPRVSDDNPYSESVFKTMKYCGMFPRGGFDSKAEAQEWLDNFVNRYHGRYHSGIGMTTPYSRFYGLDKAILAKRAALIEKQRALRPDRWISGRTLNCDYVESVSLNPDQPRRMQAVTTNHGTTSTAFETAMKDHETASTLAACVMLEAGQSAVHSVAIRGS